MNRQQEKAMWAKHGLHRARSYPETYNSKTKQYITDFEKHDRLVNKRQNDLKNNLRVLSEDNYKQFHLVELTDPKEIEKHGGYHYLISSGTYNHTAFRTKDGLDEWLSNHDLKIIPREKDEWLRGNKIKGEYKVVHLSGHHNQLDEFAKKRELKKIEVLVNGHYSNGYVEKTKNGNIIYQMNVNYPHIELPYKHK